MKSLNLFIFLMVLLAASSCTPQVSIDASSQSAHVLPASQVSEHPTDDPLLDGVKFSFSVGPHAATYSCEQCHATPSGELMNELAWFDEAAGQVEVVSTATELCVRCHPNQGDKNMMENSLQFAHTDFECTDCHNAHSTQTGCTQSTCHNDIRNITLADVERPDLHPTSGDLNAHMCTGEVCHNLAKQVAAAPIYHQPVHSEVPCYVCHDATGMAIDKGEDQAWVTVADPNQSSGLQEWPLISHALGRKVNCEKCHFPNNPWGLVETPLSN